MITSFVFYLTFRDLAKINKRYYINEAKLAVFNIKVDYKVINSKKLDSKKSGLKLELDRKIDNIIRKKSN